MNRNIDNKTRDVIKMSRQARDIFSSAEIWGTMQPTVINLLP